MRNVRREANDELKKLSKDGTISEDDEHARRAGRPEAHRPLHRAGRRAAEEEESGDHGGLTGAAGPDRSRTAPTRSRAEELQARGNLPRHVAIIMDGNGRWAQAPRPAAPARPPRRARGGARRRCEGCRALGIEVLTLYTFSPENWSRPRRGRRR